MENFVTLLVPAILALILARLLFTPIRLLWKLLLNSACGFACLWLLNTLSGFTGILFPINAVTVLTAGFLGIPGMALLAILAVL